MLTKLVVFWLCAASCLGSLDETRVVDTTFVTTNTLNGEILHANLVRPGPTTQNFALVDADELIKWINLFNSMTTGQITTGLSSGKFDTITQVIQTTTMSQKDWETVFQQTYTNDQQFTQLLNIGNGLPFGSKKTIYYISLINFLESHKTDSRVAVIWELRQSGNLNLNFDALATSNPFYLFLKLEANMKSEMESACLSMVNNNNLLENQKFNEIAWNALAEIHLSHFPDTELPLLSILKKVFLANYDKINFGQLISQIETIPNDSDNNKIKKLLLYVALFYTSDQESDSDIAIQHYFDLGLSFERFIANIVFGIRHTYFVNMCNNIKNNYHGCFRNVITAAANQKFLIRNRHFSNEYLYIVVPNVKTVKDYWHTTPVNFNRATYRPIFTWRPGGASNSQYRWYIEREQNQFWLKSAGYENLYLDATHVHKVHATTSATRRSDLALTFQPSRLDRNACYIQNAHTKKAIYAGANNVAEDQQRRTVFTNGVGNHAYLWYITKDN